MLNDISVLCRGTTQIVNSDVRNAEPTWLEQITCKEEPKLAVTNYHTVNGTLRGEDTSGTRLGYLTDALGSVTATIASDGVVQNTYRYKPYGQQLAKTGVGVDPKFQHAGDTGSRKTGLDYSEQYNRARHLDTTTGRWTTIDKLWPGEPAFGYSNANPVRFIDPTGRNWVDCPPEWKGALVQGWLKMRDRVKKLCPNPDNPPISIVNCWKNCGDNSPRANAECMCKHGSDVKNFGIDFLCKSGPGCDWSPIGSVIGCNGACMCTTAGWYGGNCQTTICLDKCSDSQTNNLDEAYFHELLHCCNARHARDKFGNDIDDTKGVPGPGGLGANVLCLLNCLRPLLGLPRSEPWIQSSTTSDNIACVREDHTA